MKFTAWYRLCKKILKHTKVIHIFFSQIPIYMAKHRASGLGSFVLRRKRWEELDQRWRTAEDKGPAPQPLHTPRTMGGQKQRITGLSSSVTLGAQESNGGSGPKYNLRCCNWHGLKAGWMTKKLTSLKQRNQSKEKQKWNETNQSPKWERETIPHLQLGLFPVTGLVNLKFTLEATILIMCLVFVLSEACEFICISSTCSI